MHESIRNVDMNLSSFTRLCLCYVDRQYLIKYPWPAEGARIPKNILLRTGREPNSSSETMSQNTPGNWRIDVHHHVVPPQYADDSMPIKLPDTETQLQSMDNWRIRTAITSLTPRVVLKNLHRLREVARICNEFQARMVLEHPARFGSFALLPLPGCRRRAGRNHLCARHLAPRRCGPFFQRK